MNDFLEEVAVRTRQRVDAQRANAPVQELRKRFQQNGPVRSFAKALSQPLTIGLIAELKQASPSAGVIRKENDIPGRIKAYTKGGASALSILTEEYYFHGSPHLLEEARGLTTIPLLRKDFIIDPYQIVESRSLGADAILLIAALLPGKRLKEFLEHTTEVGLDALVEIHDESELSHALESGAKIIGINNRNLHTLRVDVETAGRIVPKIPKSSDQVIVIESGVKDPSELTRFRSWGANAVLIGETLMRSADPESAVRAFVTAGRTTNTH